MRILLINPKTNTKYPQPPIGLLSVGSACIDAKHTVRIVDLNNERTSLKRLVFDADIYDVVGVTAMSLTYKEAEKIATAIRATHPYKNIIIGGVHATVAFDEVWRTGIYNAVITGETELIIPLVLRALSENKSGIYHGGLIENLDKLPELKYDLLNNVRAKMSYGDHSEFMPVMTSRGCPFKCSFCCRIFGKQYRTVSIERFKFELYQLYHKYKYKEIKFYDDVFTLDKDRAVEISNTINNQMRWTCQTRVNLVDKKTLQAMKDGGCYSVAFGIESGDKTILKSISKNVSLEQVERAVRYSKEVGLRVIGYFMLGSPGETLETIKTTVDYANSLDIDHAQFSIATALPGSELYYDVPEHLRANSYALKDVDNPSLCELSSKQLLSALHSAEKR